VTVPPYIPGLAAVILATAAALTPEQAQALSEVGFLRWLLVAVCGGGGIVLWRLLNVMNEVKALLSTQSQAREAIILDAAKEAMKP
jgi:hypothetical protein